MSEGDGESDIERAMARIEAELEEEIREAEAAGFVNVELSDEGRGALDAAFVRLDRALEANAPEVGKGMSPPATEAEIAGLREALGGVIHEPLERWFGWHNGASSLRFSLLPLGSPITVERTVADLEATRGFPGMGKRLRWVKILDDYAGDGYFLDLSAAEPRVYYDMLELPTEPECYGTLADFIGYIAECFENGAVFFDGELLDYDEEKFERLEAAHLARVAGG